MTFNIILPLSLLARSILVVLCNTEAAMETAMEAVSLKSGEGVGWGAIPLRVLKTPHTAKMEITSCLTDFGVVGIIA